MKAWFNKQSRLIQIILLLIPFVNWVIELVLRWSDFLESKGNVIKLVMAILATVSFGILGWVDLVWCLLFKHMLLAE